ncbi:MAG TPA: hypothetical protein VIL97_10560, partial [Thermoanaerobaculia bacterium]
MTGVCAIAWTVSLGAADQAGRNVYGIHTDPQRSATLLHGTLGAKYVRVEIPWAVSDSRGGLLRFDTENDRNIAEIEAAGMRAFPTIIIGRGWMNGLTWPPESNEPRSVPPGDLSTTLDPITGYSPTYFTFLRDFVTHYRGHFDYVAIEHEIDNPQLWSGNASEYLRLLKTASMAIRSADPNAIVTHAGLSSGFWGLVIAKDWISRGLESTDDAVDFALRYLNSEQPVGSVPSQNQVKQTIEESLTRSTSEFNETQLPFVNSILDGISGSVDAINLHYHHDARYLYIVAQWLHERASRAPSPYTPMILTNDLGVIGTPDLGCSSADPFSAQELDGQARRLFKRLLAARTARIEPIVVSSFENVCRDTVVEPHHADLFDPTRPGELRPSGASFRRFVDATSAMTDARAFSAGPELFAVWFDDTEGRQALLVAWSEVPGGQTMSLIVSRTFESAVVTDYAGNTSTIPIANGDLRVTINATPVLIHLVPPATPPPPLGIESVSPPTGNTAGGTIVTIV